MSTRKPSRTRHEVMQFKSPISLKLGANVGFVERIVVAKSRSKYIDKQINK